MSLDNLVLGQDNGYVIIFSAGLFTTKEETKALIPRSLEERAKIIIPKLTGKNGEPFSIEKDINIIKEIMQETFEERIYLAGWSYGGYISAIAATKINPDAILLFNPINSLKDSISNIFPQRYKGILRTFINSSILKSLDKLFLKFISSKKTDGLYFRDLKISIKSLKEIRKSPFLRYIAPQIGCPVLIIHGREDQISKYGNSIVFYKNLKIKDKRIITPKNVSHQITDYKDLDTKLGKWLDNHKQKFTINPFFYLRKLKQKRKKQNKSIHRKI